MEIEFTGSKVTVNSDGSTVTEELDTVMLANSISLAPLKVVLLGAFDSDPTGLTFADKGTVWYNTHSNEIKYWDGSYVIAVGAAGAGFTNLNGQTGGTQLFGTVGTAGTAPTWLSASNTHTLNIPMASTAGVTAGLLSKTEYDTIGAEATARAMSDSSLQSALNIETTSRTVADSSLQASLNIETTSRFVTDSSLQAALNTETTSRTATDSSLQASLNAEITSRTVTDSSLQSALNIETTSRTVADSSLQASLNIETTSRFVTDSSLQAALNTETTSRIIADSSLQAAISFLSGLGTPIGVILPWVSGYFTFASGTNTGHTPILASADTVAAANTYLNPLGYYICDGSAVNVTGSPIWNAAGRYIPNLTDSRFLMGSTTIGTIANGGSNTMADHKHANTNLSVVAEALHTHGAGTYAIPAAVDHTHGAGLYVNAPELAHTHIWPTNPSNPTNGKGTWNNDTSTGVATADDNGDGGGNTYSDTGNGIFPASYWGAGTYKAVTTASDSGDLTHSHTVRTNSFAGDRPVGMGSGGADSSWYMIQDALIANAGQLYANSDNASLAHSHTYYLPSHRHWIKARATTAGSSHNHIISGSSGSGGAHNHTISGASAASSHTHSLFGVVGSGSTDPVAGTIENRPQYMKCFMIIRVV